MDKPSAQTQAHVSTTYRRVIKDIENLEQFYDAKVLAIGSKNVSKKPAVSFKTKLTMPKQEQKPAYYIYGDTDPNDSDNRSFYPGRNDVPDTPLPKTPRQAKIQMRGMWGNQDDKKSRWGPPTLVHGNNNYLSSVLDKGSYL